MASDAKKTKAEPAPKTETASKTETAAKKEAVPADKAADTSKAESGESSGGAPKNYSRGEGQKPVTQAYKDNWNLIFGPKKKSRR